MITLTNGNLQNLAGLVVPNGWLSIAISQDATQIASPFATIMGGYTQWFKFDANGNLPALTKIYSNIELSPTTTYTVNFYDPNRSARLNANPIVWYFTQAAGSTVDIGTIIPITGSSQVPPMAGANSVYAGPPTGVVAAPSFRALVAADVPFATYGLTDGVVFVSTSGSDLNDGLSPGRTKLTIQAAINALPARGGIVQLLAGAFGLTSQLTLKSNLTICGVGRGDTSETPATLITTNITSGDLFSIANMKCIRLADFAIQNTAGIGSNAAIRLNYGQFCAFERLFISGNFAKGVLLESSSTSLGSTIRNFFENVFITSIAPTGTGVELNSHDGAANGKTINNNWFVMVAAQGGVTGGFGLKVTNSDNGQAINENLFYGDQFTTARGGSGGTGIWITQAATAGIKFMCCNIEANKIGVQKDNSNTVLFDMGNISSNDTNITDAQPAFTGFLMTRIGGVVQQFSINPAGDIDVDGIGLNATAIQNGINGGAGWPLAVASVTKATVNADGLNVKRLKASQGATAYSGADAAIAPNAVNGAGGWGTGAVVVSASGTDQSFSFGIQAAGAPGASPTCIITFKDGTWTNTPKFMVMRNDVNAPVAAGPPLTWINTATTLTITFVGTPVAGTQYNFNCMAMGQ